MEFVSEWKIHSVVPSWNEIETLCEMDLATFDNRLLPNLPFPHCLQPHNIFQFGNVVVPIPFHTTEKWSYTIIHILAVGGAGSYYLAQHTRNWWRRHFGIFNNKIYLFLSMVWIRIRLHIDCALIKRHPKEWQTKSRNLIKRRKWFGTNKKQY